MRIVLRYLLGLILILSFSNSTFAGSTCPTTIPPCPGFTTYTQGGWGAAPNGNNPGTYLQNNFAAAFPNGLTIGCTNKIILTNATAVKGFLPQGSTARALNAGTLTNPSKTTYSNVLAGQLVAATLSVTFDRQFANFGSSSTNLGNLIISSGTFQNWTVDQLLLEANKFIGGCPSATGKTAADYNTALTNINQSYDNGISAGNYLLCPIKFTATANPVKCYNGNTGSASITNISGGAGAPYTILWSNGATSFTISNLTAGTYNFTITDAIGLTKTGSVVITQPAQLTASASTQSNIACYGGTTVVAVSANGGTPPYTGTGNFTVGAGTYNYSITDANACPANTSITVTQPTQLSINVSAGSILCYGGATNVTVTANGGTAPYTGTGSFSVVAGTYSYTVTDANGCTKTASITVSQPSALTATATKTSSIKCNGGTATVDVTANGGTAPYTGTGTFTVTAGTHTYTVTDANGCTYTTSINITQPSPLVANAVAGTINCKGGTTTITVTANGGTTPYVGTGIFTVNAGTYNYTVSDSNACQATTGNIIVTEPSLLTISVNADTIKCNGGTTTIYVNGNGGTAPYTGTGSFTNKAAGTYSYSITDAKGCTASAPITISQPPVLTASASAGSILCYGGTTTITVNANGGTAPYIGTGNFTNIAAGTYNYTVTDANLCTATASATVNAAPSAINITGNSTNDNSCNGGACSGTATINVNGGTAPYTYSWTNNASTSNSAIGFCANTSTLVTVTDSNNCVATKSFSFICVPTPCPSCDGYVTFTQGGWGSTPNGNNPGTILNNSFTTAFPNGLTIGCTNKITFTSAAAVRAFLPSGTTARALNAGTLTNPTSATYKNVLAGQLVAAMLSAKIDATVNSFAPSNQKLENLVINTGTFKNMTVAQVLAAANQFIGGCASPYSATDLNTILTSINQSWDNGISSGASNVLACPIKINKTIVNNKCNGDQKGSITLSACGGCGNFTFTWANGSNATSLNNLGAGVYTVTISDACGMSKKDTIIITEPSALVLTPTTYDDNSCNDGICSGLASVSASGGTSPYQYAWSSGGNTSTLSGLCVGSNPVVNVTDANGCVKPIGFIINCTPEIGNCEPLKTYRAVAWDTALIVLAAPKTNLSNDFNKVFPAPNYLRIGSGNNYYTFVNPSDVTNVIPSTGPAGVLTAPFGTTPTSLNNEFASRLIAATLNVQYDYFLPNFAAPLRKLGTMYCNFAPFLGMQVDQVILEANQAIGGKPTAHTISDLSMALDFINRNYENGDTDNGDLVCDDPLASRAVNPNSNSTNSLLNGSNSNSTQANSFNLFPNPSDANQVNIQFTSTAARTALVNIYSITGQLLITQNINATAGVNTIPVNISSINSSNSLVVVRLTIDGKNYQSNLTITR